MLYGNILKNKEINMQNLLEDLKELLQTDQRFVIDGSLFKNKIVECALKCDEGLISLLLESDTIKRHFFTQVAGVLVFDKIKFQQFVSNKQFLPDSFTAFKNKIGLTAGGDYLSENKDIVLSWGYKDCVLEGGQSREEDRRNEIFFNETLAPDEIDRLLDPKILTNAKRYTADGEKPFDTFHRNEQGIITDNLIIKGNNLLALHSLKKQFAGQVKLIYIDPPYNTGNDGFKYNDSFNHSTWLTFMKNRLEISKRLLKNNGAIFISMDAKEIAYLQVLMDEIFGKENFKNLITVQRSAISGPKVINPGVVNVSEYVLVYSKSENWEFNRAYARRNRDPRYGNFIENIDDDYKNWRFIPLVEAFVKANGKDLKTLKKRLADNWDDELDNFVIENVKSVVQYANLDENSVSAAATELKKLSKDNSNIVYKLERDNKEPYFVYHGKVILFYKDRVREIDGKLSPSEPVSDIWTDVLPNDLHNEGGVDFRKGKKTEKLVSRIIEIGTNPSEIILDFHLGSGTTAAVAHKMGRQYIGIEQMDYGENDSVVRLQNVIGKQVKKADQFFETAEFDTRGISKSVNWRGGGEFVYLELKKYNQAFIDSIASAESTADMLKVWAEMKKHSFLNCSADIKKYEAEIAEFERLSLAKQKRILLAIMDMNQLYVNLSSLEDSDFEYTNEEKRITKDFYKA
jgi:adenine-specific DNA-methyltransferase